MMTWWRGLSGLYRLAAVIMVCMVAMAVLAPVLAPYDPDAVSPEEILQYSSSSHWLGTDALGRDILARTMYGARTSVAFAAAAACCTMALGMILGMMGGYFGVTALYFQVFI